MNNNQFPRNGQEAGTYSSGSEGESFGSSGAGLEWRYHRDNCFMLYEDGLLVGMVRDWPEPWQKDPSEKWSYTIPGECKNHYFPTEEEAKSALIAATTFDGIKPPHSEPLLKAPQKLQITTIPQRDRKE